MNEPASSKPKFDRADVKQRDCLGKKFIGIELDEGYFEIACKRIEDAYKQPDLFVSPPTPPPEQQGFDLG